MSKPSISNEIRTQLETLAKEDQGIREKFSVDDRRVEKFSYDLAGITMDLSKTHISDSLLDVYTDCAKQINFEAKRHALFSGERINVTENRSVLHTLLRDSSNQGIDPSDPDVLAQAESSKQQFADQYAVIRAQLDKRAVPITDIIHVGIGGSSLGTQLVFEALTGISDSMRVHFIANIDAHHLVSVLEQCSVESTLVIGVSKTFTTAETLQNLGSIAAWFKANGVANVLDSFYAVTANPDSADKYGIPKDNVVSFPQWVGGRYSVWSSVSLSAALVLGIDKFNEFLAGAAVVDQHFYQTEPRENLCFIAASMDNYYANYLGAKSRGIFAYDYRLRSIVGYLQQLETESNGKDRQINGDSTDQHTSGVIWGGVGTDVQHSVFQMLHQGTELIPAEFILVINPDHDLGEHHVELLANGLAQTAALLSGQNLSKVSELHADENLSELTLKAKVFSGNRPSTTFLIESLNPHALGAMLAFYEHRTFCSGVLANINSYDQMGVELGKRLANQLSRYLQPESVIQQTDQPTVKASPFDASTNQLIKKVIQQQRTK